MFDKPTTAPSLAGIPIHLCTDGHAIPTPTAREPQVLSAAASAVSDAERLVSMMASLRDRLNLVLRNEPTNTKEAPCRPPSTVPLVEAFSRIAESHQSLSRIIDDISTRLEI